MIYPKYREIKYQDPLTVFKVFAEEVGAIFLESAIMQTGAAQFSFIAVDPFMTLRFKNSDEDPFQRLKEALAEFPLQFYESMPPFQGGAAGFFSYDLCHYLEKIPRVKDDMDFPDLLLGFYDLVIAFDQDKKEAWVFSSGYPEQDEKRRKKRACDRMEWVCHQILLANETLNIDAKLPDPVLQSAEIQSGFTQSLYEEAVQKAKDYIIAGDIFEVNISQRFKTKMPANMSAFDLYQKLRSINPAPFSAFFNGGDTVIASASPERFLKLTGKKVETRPIKGTRPRGKNREEDLAFAKALSESSKDHAENVMIVDLLRNDLSRVSENNSVVVTQLCALESFATVHHLVSVVKSVLREECDVIDLLRATFPGGSITGAPKIRAMEIIAEVEPTARGPYCGSVGYVGFNGNLDLSITIRTFSIKNNIVTFQAGGAVTLDSDPTEEYNETLTKSKALRAALL